MFEKFKNKKINDRDMYQGYKYNTDGNTNNNYDESDIVFTDSKIKHGKLYTVYTIIRFCAKKICLWGVSLSLVVSMIVEENPKYNYIEDIASEVFHVLFVIIIILIGTYFLIDSCLAVLVRKKNCTEEVEGKINVERCIEVEMEGARINYEFLIGLRYYYKGCYYVYRFEDKSSIRDKYVDGLIKNIYVKPNEPLYFIMNKHKINEKSCIIKGVIGAIILLPFAVFGGALLLIAILSVLSGALALIDKILL